MTPNLHTRGQGFTEGTSHKRAGADFPVFNTHIRTSERRTGFPSPTQLPPEHGSACAVGHVCFISRSLGFQQLSIATAYVSCVMRHVLKVDDDGTDVSCGVGVLVLRE